MAIFNTVYGGEWKWKPGANTVAYFPLKTDLLDHGPNEYSMTNLGGVMLSNGTGYFNGSSRLYKTDVSSGLPLTTSPKTVSLWANFSEQRNNCIICGFGTVYRDNANKSYIINTLSKKISFSSWGGSYDFQGTVIPTVGQWYYCVATYDGTSYTLYVNGIQDRTGTVTLGTTGTKLCLGASSDTASGYEAYFKGYLSEVIIENKAWTANEISNYYNGTKANYGY